MNKFLSAGAAVLTAVSMNSANAGPTPEAVVINLTNKAVLAQLCRETTNTSGVRVDGTDICQVSPDGGKTWISMPAALFGLLGLGGGAAYMVRRKKTGAAPEAEATAGAAPEAEATAGAASEAETTAGAASEAEATAGAASEADHRTAKSKWEDISQDIRYNINDSHNAKQLLRRLISKYRSGYDSTSSPENTANSAFLNKLMGDLKSREEVKKRIAIQVIFAIAKVEGIDSIPNPVV